MPLSDDACRCHDDECPTREICERYLQRGTGRVHDRSLRFKPGCEQFDYCGEGGED